MAGAVSMAMFGECTGADFPGQGRRPALEWRREVTKMERQRAEQLARRLQG